MKSLVTLLLISLVCASGHESVDLHVEMDAMREHATAYIHELLSDGNRCIYWKDMSQEIFTAIAAVSRLQSFQNRLALSSDVDLELAREAVEDHREHIAEALTALRAKVVVKNKK
jgi:hypothetical protein